VHVRRDRRRVVERAAADEEHVGAPVVAVHRDLTRRAAVDALLAAVVAGNVHRLRLLAEQLDAVRLDEQVDHDRAPGLSLAVQAVAAVG
jgi:hypothetical protein